MTIIQGGSTHKAQIIHHVDLILTLGSFSAVEASSTNSTKNWEGEEKSLSFTYEEILIMNFLIY